MSKHQFLKRDDGKMTHLVDGEVRAIVDPDNFEAYKAAIGPIAPEDIVNGDLGITTPVSPVDETGDDDAAAPFSRRRHK